MSRKKKKNDLKFFKVYYYVGDYFSSDGEEQRTKIIHANSEIEAEYLFKLNYPKYSFGWAEEIVK